jgi:hypothetical protein
MARRPYRPEFWCVAAGLSLARLSGSVRHDGALDKEGRAP